jgi:hypothetical protein
MKMLRTIVAPLLFMLWWGSCSKPKVEIPADILRQDSMILVLSDIHFAEAAIQMRNLARDSSTRQESYRRYRYIFDEHGIDAVYFDKSFRWYAAHPEIFQKMYDSVLVKLSVAQGSVAARP